MGRDKTDKSRKRKHRHDSHRSRHSDSEDDSNSSASSSTGSESESESYSDSLSSSGSESESESLEEEERPSKSRKKARRSSESEKRRKSSKGRSKEKEKRKSKGSSRKKERRKKKPKAKKRETISMDDYYLKSAEFRTWLSKERGVFFSELTSEESRKLFKKFVSKWNSGLLKKKYYQGIQSTAVGHDTQSKYQWKFASGLDSGELKSMRESVSSWTASTPGGQEEVGEATRPGLIGPQRPGPSIQSRPGIGPSIGPSFKGSSSRSMDPFEREERREEERGKLKKERRDFRKHQEAVLEELVPKAGPGREARLEKKKMMAQKRREREISPEMAESTLMGPTANIKEKIRNRQEERQTRAEAAAQKISDYQAREKAKMAAILEMAKANKKEGALW